MISLYPVFLLMINKNKFPDKKRVPSTSEAKQFYKKTYKTWYH